MFFSFNSPLCFCLVTLVSFFHITCCHSIQVMMPTRFEMTETACYRVFAFNLDKENMRESCTKCLQLVGLRTVLGWGYSVPKPPPLALGSKPICWREVPSSEHAWAGSLLCPQHIWSMSISVNWSAFFPQQVCVCVHVYCLVFIILLELFGLKKKKSVLSEFHSVSWGLYLVHVDVLPWRWPICLKILSSQSKHAACRQVEEGGLFLWPLRTPRVDFLKNFPSFCYLFWSEKCLPTSEQPNMSMCFLLLDTVLNCGLKCQLNNCPFLPMLGIVLGL